MTNDQKKARRSALLNAIKESERPSYEALVSMMVDLESRIDTIGKKKLVNTDLLTITPYATLYRQLTGQYCELFNQYSKATTGSTESSPFEEFLKRYI